MFKQNTFSQNDLYRGSLPFFLAEEKKGVVFSHLQIKILKIITTH